MSGAGAELQVRALSAGYGRGQVLHGVDVFVRSGCATAVLGANGAGKTTLLRAISRTVQASGEVLLNGLPLTDLRPEGAARLGLAHVPEGRGTFAGLSVEDNLRLGARRGWRRAQVHAKLREVYRTFPKLGQRARQQAGTLSGGEQQMLAIGRALMGEPTMLMLDEPSVGLAPIVVKEIFGILDRIRREQGVSLLVVDQNAARALAIADDAFVMEAGRVVIHGPARDIASDASVRKAYLGC